MLGNRERTDAIAGFPLFSLSEAATFAAVRHIEGEQSGGCAHRGDDDDIGLISPFEPTDRKTPSLSRTDKMGFDPASPMRRCRTFPQSCNLIPRLATNTLFFSFLLSHLKLLWFFPPSFNVVLTFIFPLRRTSFEGSYSVSAKDRKET